MGVQPRASTFTQLSLEVQHTSLKVYIQSPKSQLRILDGKIVESCPINLERWVGLLSAIPMQGQQPIGLTQYIRQLLIPTITTI